MSDKRQRSDSLEGEKEIVKGALEVIDPPLGIDLGAGVRPYWDKLVKAKAARAWTDPDLLMLVELSRNLYRTEKLSREILIESEVYETERGVMLNPKSKLIDELVKRARIIMVMLQLHPEATQGKAREQVKQNQAHQKAVEMTTKSSDDELFASPKH